MKKQNKNSKQVTVKDLQKAVDETAAKKSAKTKTVKRNRPDEVFGHKAVAVARTLGKAGFKPSDAVAAIHAFQKKAKSSVNAIKTFVFAGRHGVRGEPAKLNKSQVKQLAQAAAEAAAFAARPTSTGKAAA